MKHVAIILLLCLSLAGKAQDVQFSQFYAAPMYLNPAFVGSSAQSRVIFNYRNQWPAVPKAYNSYNFSYDHNLTSINSGVGVMVHHDKAGTGGLKYTNLALQYGYAFRVNNDWVIKPAMQYSFTWRSIDRAELVFGDQIIRGGANTSVEQFNIEGSRYFDFSAGVLTYSRKQWIGFSWHHINQPNQSLIFSEAKLPFKISLHGGLRVNFDAPGANRPDHVLIPAFNYKFQEKFDQLDVGFYYEHDPIVIGLWYRGIPGIKSYQPGYQNNDAVIFLFGYEIPKVGAKIGYSYDLTVSRLISNTAGSHEISIQFEWAGKDKKLSQLKRNVPCPKF